MQPFGAPLTAIKPGRFGSFTILLGGIEAATARKIKGGHYVVKITDCNHDMDHLTGTRDQAIAYALSVLWDRD